MNTDAIWLNARLGFEHILDPAGLDHVLFLLVLVALMDFRDWKSVLWAVTAFTIGHSLTLAWAPASFVEQWQGWIEWGIPLTIFLSGWLNILRGEKGKNGSVRWLMAGLFGLIHGLGFGNYFRMLSAGSDSKWADLLPFSLGIESGQLLVVLAFMMLSWAFRNAFAIKLRDWNLVVSGMGTGIAFLWMLERFP